MALRGLSTVAVAMAVRPPPPPPPRSHLRVDSGAWRLCCGDRITSSSAIRIGCKAVGENRQGSLDDSVVYEGIYGPWTIDSSDVREVS